MTHNGAGEGMGLCIDLGASTLSHVPPKLTTSTRTRARHRSRSTGIDVAECKDKEKEKEWDKAMGSHNGKCKDKCAKDDYLDFTSPKSSRQSSTARLKTKGKDKRQDKDLLCKRENVDMGIYNEEGNGKYIITKEDDAGQESLMGMNKSKETNIEVDDMGYLMEGIWPNEKAETVEKVLVNYYREEEQRQQLVVDCFKCQLQRQEDRDDCLQCLTESEEKQEESSNEVPEGKHSKKEIKGWNEEEHEEEKEDEEEVNELHKHNTGMLRYREKFRKHPVGIRKQPAVINHMTWMKTSFPRTLAVTGGQRPDFVHKRKTGYNILQPRPVSAKPKVTSAVTVAAKPKASSQLLSPKQTLPTSNPIAASSSAKTKVKVLTAQSVQNSCMLQNSSPSLTKPKTMASSSTARKNLDVDPSTVRTSENVKGSCSTPGRTKCTNSEPQTSKQKMTVAAHSPRVNAPTHISGPTSAKAKVPCWGMSSASSSSSTTPTQYQDETQSKRPVNISTYAPSKPTTKTEAKASTKAPVKIIKTPKKAAVTTSETEPAPAYVRLPNSRLSAAVKPKSKACSPLRTTTSSPVLRGRNNSSQVTTKGRLPIFNIAITKTKEKMSNIERSKGKTYSPKLKIPLFTKTKGKTSNSAPKDNMCISSPPISVKNKISSEEKVSNSITQFRVAAPDTALSEDVGIPSTPTIDFVTAENIMPANGKLSSEANVSSQAKVSSAAKVSTPSSSSTLFNFTLPSSKSTLFNLTLPGSTSTLFNVTPLSSNRTLSSTLTTYYSPASMSSADSVSHSMPKSSLFITPSVSCTTSSWATLSSPLVNKDISDKTPIMDKIASPPSSLASLVALSQSIGKSNHVECLQPNVLVVNGKVMVFKNSGVPQFLENHSRG